MKLFPPHLTMLRSELYAPSPLLAGMPPASAFPLFDGKHFRSSSHNLMQIHQPKPEMRPWSSLSSLNIDFNKSNIFIFFSPPPPHPFLNKFLCISLASRLVLGLTFALAAHAVSSHVLRAAARPSQSGNSIKSHAFTGYFLYLYMCILCTYMYTCLLVYYLEGSEVVFRFSRVFPIQMPLVSFHTQPHGAYVQHENKQTRVARNLLND